MTGRKLYRVTLTDGRVLTVPGATPLDARRAVWARYGRGVVARIADA